MSPVTIRYKKWWHRWRTCNLKASMQFTITTARDWCVRLYLLVCTAQLQVPGWVVCALERCFIFFFGGTHNRSYLAQPAIFFPARLSSARRVGHLVLSSTAASKVTRAQFFFIPRLSLKWTLAIDSFVWSRLFV